MIVGWLPPPVTNTSRQRHWATVRKEVLAVKTMAWSAARQAEWQYVAGRVRLTVTLVFGVKRSRDSDNTTARCKHLIDGLKGEFFADDCSEVLELLVHTEVSPGNKATRMQLEAL